MPRRMNLIKLFSKLIVTNEKKWFRNYTDNLSSELFYIIASCISKMFIFGSQNLKNHNFFKKFEQSKSSQILFPVKKIFR